MEKIQNAFLLFVKWIVPCAVLFVACSSLVVRCSSRKATYAYMLGFNEGHSAASEEAKRKRVEAIWGMTLPKYLVVWKCGNSTIQKASKLKVARGKLSDSSPDLLIRFRVFVQFHQNECRSSLAAGCLPGDGVHKK